MDARSCVEVSKVRQVKALWMENGRECSRLLAQMHLGTLFHGEPSCFLLAIPNTLGCYTIPYHALPYTGMHMETVTYMGRFLALRQQHPPEDVLCPRLHPL